MSELHSGHRQRLRTRAAEEGLASFQPHEVLELLLTQAIPQRDVNPLAHALFEAFGSVDAVLSASEEELMRVPGVGKRTARWLRAMGGLTDAYARQDPGPRREISTFQQAASYLEGRRIAKRSTHLLLCMDSASMLRHTAVLEAAPGAFPGVRDAVAAALRCRAAFVCSVHVLPRGAADIEREQRYAEDLNAALRLIDIEHLDHILVTGGRAVSVRRTVERAAAQEEEMAAERPFAPPEGGAGTPGRNRRK